VPREGERLGTAVIRFGWSCNLKPPSYPASAY